MDAEFSHDDCRFRAAQSNDATIESGDPLLTRKTRFPDIKQGFGTNARQKENDVYLASEELLGKFERSRIVFQGNFPHGRDNHGFSPGAANERGHLFAAAGFETTNTRGNRHRQEI